MAKVFVSPSFGQNISYALDDLFAALKNQDAGSRDDLMDIWERARQGDNGALDELFEAFRSGRSAAALASGKFRSGRATALGGGLEQDLMLGSAGGGGSSSGGGGG